MKKRNILFAILLAVSMLFTACGNNSAKLEGNWVGKLDVTKQFEDGIKAATEIGYEYAFRNSNAIGVMAYLNVGLWGTRAEMTDKPIISVAPITDGNNPVPEVSVNDAYHSLLNSYMPLQFGVKVYYAFNLTK